MAAGASTYLRIVATRRCPLSCSYCHREAEATDDVADLSPVELGGIVSAGVRAVGIGKVKLTGGDPFARTDLPDVAASIVAAAPGVDLSAVTPGILPVDRARAARMSGLGRSNLSVHGFTRAAFTARGNPPRRYAAWRNHFDFWSRLGRSPKLNYVYGGPGGHDDLAALLAFASEHRAMVRLLDDLSGPPVSVDDLRAVLFDLCGRALRSTRHHGPHSLPTERLEWPAGATVELKATRLGELSPLSACSRCARRAACREGIHAWRLTADGRLKPCALRDDLGIPIVEILRSDGVDGAAEAWSALARRMTP